MATRKQGSMKDAPRPVKAGGGDSFSAPEKRHLRVPQTVQNGKLPQNPAPRPAMQASVGAPVTAPKTGNTGKTAPVNRIPSAGNQPVQKRKAGAPPPAATPHLRRPTETAINAKATPARGKAYPPSTVRYEEKPRPAPRQTPKDREASPSDPRFHTSLNWRHVGESGEEGDYKSPRFQGAVREYVPKEAPHARQGMPAASRGRDAMKNLQEQTPNRRRERVKRSRRQNLESLHRANFRQQFRVVEKKKRPRGFYLKVIGATLALYLLFLGGFAAFFASNLLKSSLQEQESVSYTVGVKGADGYIKTKIRYGTLFRDGVMYLNMNHIASLCDLTTTGDLTRMRYYSRGEVGHSAVFLIGSRTALINGTPVTLEGQTYLDGDTVYVAADFFTRFVSGLDVIWDAEKNAVSVSRVVIATSLMKGDQYAEVTFGLDPGEAEAAIDFSSLDLELRMQIEALYGSEIPPASDDGAIGDPDYDEEA